MHIPEAQPSETAMALQEAAEQLSAWARRYGGTAAAFVEGSTFSIDVLLPLKQASWRQLPEFSIVS